MLYQIISHTPIWVWALFVLLISLGLRQSQPSATGLKRITLIPLAMLGLSLYGALSVSGIKGDVLVVWGCAAVLAAAITLQIPLDRTARYNTWMQRFELPGSWIPLVLMMGIFLTKYGVGITATMHPELLRDPVFSYSICAIYGAFSGVFAGRALRLWQLVWHQASGSRSLEPAQ